MNRRWLWALLLLPAAGLFFWGPDLLVRVGERGEFDNLRRLSGAIALYTADHENRYPLVTGEEATQPVFKNGQLISQANPLAPYVKAPIWLFSPGTRVAYQLRFVVPIREKNPRDPMAPVERRLSILPDPRAVIIASPYTNDWQRGWTNMGQTMFEGQAVQGYAHFLRGDGHVETTDLSKVRFATYDGEQRQWGEPGPAKYHFDSGKAWANSPWWIYPGEPWPLRATEVAEK